MARTFFVALFLASCGGATSTGPRNYDVVVEGSHSHFIGGGAVPDDVDAGLATPVDGGVQTVVPIPGLDGGRVLQGSLDGGAALDAGGAIMPIPGGPVAGASGDAVHGSLGDAMRGAPLHAGLDTTGAVITREPLVTAAIERVPYQTWPAVPGHVEGLLYASGPQAWGAAYEHTRGLATSPDRTEYKFGFDRSSPYAEYFVSDGRGYNFMRGWNPSGPPHDVAMFLPTTASTLGLGRPAHVVVLEANDGQGAAANNIHFVVTGVRVIDGTPAVPMDPTAVLTALRARAEATVAGLAAGQAQRMARAATVAQAHGATRGAAVTTIGMWPTWIQADHTLEVVFVGSVMQTSTFPAQTVAVPCPRCPCARRPNGEMTCAPCVACNPTQRVVTPHSESGFDVAITDRVDASGRLLTERIAGPHEI